jgi:hypothetical protein
MVQLENQFLSGDVNGWLSLFIVVSPFLLIAAPAHEDPIGVNHATRDRCPIAK